MIEAIVAYAAANLLDVISTNKLLSKGGQELNPVMRWAMDKFGKLWVIPKLALAGVALMIFLHFNLVYMIWVGSALVGLVAINNFRIAKKLKDK